MKIIKFSLPLFFLLIQAIGSDAQTITDTSTVWIETRNGNEYVGQITSQDSVRILLSTQNLGVITILKSDILSQEKVLPQLIKDGEIWTPNPLPSRYFWTPSGYGIKKGKGYYQNIWVLWNQFAYGVTENFSIGGAVIPLFLFGGGPTPVFLNPKISVPVIKDKLNLGAGSLIGTVVGESESTFGIVYGVSTFGTPDKNISLGLGYGFFENQWASSPLINISGMFRLSKKWYFITENYTIGFGDDFGGIVSGGGRLAMKKATLDFGLFFPVGADAGLIALPWLGFTIPFGHSN